MLSSEKGRLLAAQMPRERMLTETDGPFAQIDGAAAAPWDCEKAIGQLAEMWAEPEASVRGKLGRNLTTLVAER